MKGFVRYCGNLLLGKSFLPKSLQIVFYFPSLHINSGHVKSDHDSSGMPASTRENIICSEPHVLRHKTSPLLPHLFILDISWSNAYSYSHSLQLRFAKLSICFFRFPYIWLANYFFWALREAFGAYGDHRLHGLHNYHWMKTRRNEHFVEVINLGASVQNRIEVQHNNNYNHFWLSAQTISLHQEETMN